MTAIAAVFLVQPGELVPLVVPLAGIILGGLVLLVPIVGLTARFAIKPLLDAWSQSRTMSQADERFGLLDQRLTLLEQQLEHVERQNQRLLEEAEFRARLENPGGGAR